MAFRSIAKGLKNFFGPNNRFFNGAREEERNNGYYPQQNAADYAQQDYQQEIDYGRQQGYPPQQGYQPPQQGFQQQGYQQQPYQAPAYQQPAQQQNYSEFQQQTVNQAYVPPRNRRASQHAQARENVVPFPGAQAQQQAQPVQQPAQQQAPAAEQKKLSACVINVRNINDCRSAIGILRAGDCVIAVIDSIADQSEVRRYVDTLNGACFSLSCTMTRTSSRVGVYFLAPSGMQVLTDQTTTQMNAQSRAPQRPRSAQPVFQPTYTAPQTVYTARSAYPQYAAPQQTQYTAAQPPVYQQQPQAAYAAQEPAQGYAPDQQPADYPQEATM